MHKPTICPAVLAKEPHEYREQIERIKPFAKRVHIDLADGRFTPSSTVGIDHVWWPDGMQADLHLMHQRPSLILDKAIKLKPHTVIVHAEADGDFVLVSHLLRSAGIRAGVALLPETPVSILKGSEKLIDYVLVFGGNLGHFGGKANLSLLGKVGEVRELNPDIEIGWDGGINMENIKTIAHSGVEVFNTGGFIQNAELPQEAYAKLKAAIKGA